MTNSRNGHHKRTTPHACHTQEVTPGQLQAESDPNSSPQQACPGPREQSSAVCGTNGVVTSREKPTSGASEEQQKSQRSGHHHTVCTITHHQGGQDDKVATNHHISPAEHKNCQPKKARQNTRTTVIDEVKHTVNIKEKIFG